MYTIYKYIYIYTLLYYNHCYSHCVEKLCPNKFFCVFVFIAAMDGREFWYLIDDRVLEGIEDGELNWWSSGVVGQAASGLSIGVPRELPVYSESEEDGEDVKSYKRALRTQRLIWMEASPAGWRNQCQAQVGWPDGQERPREALNRDRWHLWRCVGSSQVQWPELVVISDSSGSDTESLVLEISSDDDMEVRE